MDMGEETATRQETSLPELTVTELSSHIKSMVEKQFPLVKVRGELSGFKRAPSGHAYFTLKDDKSVLSGVCWRGNMARVSHPLEDGMEVICYGKVTTYAGQSRYQLMAETMEPAGIGSLMAVMEKRKAQLMQEGLFEAHHKKPLPRFPRVVGVVTSPTGAVIHDILHRVRDRFPVDVILWPVLVQGEGSADQIAAAIRGFNALNAHGSVPKPDVLIVGRGGGSIEDLWSFNEENVVRAAFASEIPLISAVGHETDVTLIDYVADRRAPTPTGAAEIALPVAAEWQNWVAELGLRMGRFMSQRLEGSGSRLQMATKSLPPIHMVLQYIAQRFDELTFRIGRATQQLLNAKQQAFQSSKPNLQTLLMLIKAQKESMQRLSTSLDRAVVARMMDSRKDLEMASGLLQSYHYSSVLKRGFSVLRDPEGGIVASSKHIIPGKAYQLELHDGTAPVRATD